MRRVCKRLRHGQPKLKIIAARIGAERVVGGFINFAADYIEPGLVRYGVGWHGEEGEGTNTWRWTASDTTSSS